MAIIDTIKKRYSVRDFSDKPVEEEKLFQILEAAQMAPSACNNQPCSCIVVRDQKRRQQLRPAYAREWFVNAPIILAVCVDVQSAWRRFDGVSYGYVDAAIMMDHIILTAAELGLGTCWIGAFKVKEAKEALALPDHSEPIVLSPLGYPNQEMPPRKRKELDEIVFWDYFGGRKR
jgi:nitroreductase